jgi:putative SOS response-associated peptidase YedK
MPVIVAPSAFATWLETTRLPAEVERLFAPAPAASLTATRCAAASTTCD